MFLTLCDNSNLDVLINFDIIKKKCSPTLFSSIVSSCQRRPSLYSYQDQNNCYPQFTRITQGTIQQELTSTKRMFLGTRCVNDITKEHSCKDNFIIENLSAKSVSTKKDLRYCQGHFAAKIDFQDTLKPSPVTQLMPM